MWTIAWMLLGAWFWPFSSGNSPSTAYPVVAAATERSAQKRVVLEAIPVEQVRDGDLVDAFDEETGEIVLRPVVRTFQRKSDHLRLVRFRDADGGIQEIATTNEHPFWVDGQGWVPSESLAEHQLLNHPTKGEHAVVLSNRLERSADGVSVFNFEVRGAHNYFVSQFLQESPILVHNMCVQQNRTNGLAAQAAFVAKLKSAGFKIVGEEVSVMTAVGRRRLDVVVERNGKLHALEIKSGGAHTDAV